MMKLNCGQSPAAFGMSVAALGDVGRPRRQAFMHADVPEARVLSELLLVPGDHLVDGIGDQLVVEPPPRHGALGVEVELGRGGDVVALPRVWMERIDLDRKSVV